MKRCEKETHGAKTEEPKKIIMVNNHKVDGIPFHIEGSFGFLELRLVMLGIKFELYSIL